MVIPDNDSAPAPFGAFAPTAAQAALLRLAPKLGLQRGAFRPWLSRLAGVLRQGPIDTSYQGGSFRFHHQASATERGALFNPDYNRAELDFMRANLAPGDVVVDIGANVGIYALGLARDVGERGLVIAVEPHPVIHARLAFNRAASGFAQVRLVAAAAGDVDGFVMIETDSGNLGASRVVTGTAPVDAIKVPSLTLQRIVAEAGAAKIDALKIDVEGFEDRVLTGFFAQAQRSLWPRAVVIEHLSRAEWRQDCIADMVARGYREAGRTRSNTLLLRGF